MSERTLTLYTRRRCPLCDRMLGGLERWRARFGFSIEKIDIDRDPALRARYGSEVPVLAEGGREICRHFLDEAALQRHLEAGTRG